MNQQARADGTSQQQLQQEAMRADAEASRASMNKLLATPEGKEKLHALTSRMNVTKSRVISNNMSKQIIYICIVCPEHLATSIHNHFYYFYCYYYYYYYPIITLLLPYDDESVWCLTGAKRCGHVIRD
jgi:hypothetical protein